MILSDISIKRPVFASVVSILLVAFGLVSFERLSLREYPDINPPVVTVEVTYPGAPANIVETRITQVIEERIAGIEGIEFIESASEDGKSTVTIEFSINRDIDTAANDVRDRISGIADNLPEEAEPPEVQKADSNDDVIVGRNLTSSGEQRNRLRHGSSSPTSSASTPCHTRCPDSAAIVLLFQVEERRDEFPRLRSNRVISQESSPAE